MRKRPNKRKPPDNSTNKQGSTKHRKSISPVGNMRALEKSALEKAQGTGRGGDEGEK